MNYKQAIEDFNNGTIDPDKYQLIIDNDGGYWLCIDPAIDDEDERDDLSQKMKEKYGSPDGYRDIVDVLNAAGVNANWC